MFLLLSATHSALAQTDTVRVSLRQVIEEAIRVSPELGVARSEVAQAEAQYDRMRSSRILPDAEAVSALAMVPGIDNPNGTPTDRLYLDPAIRNDYESLRPYAQAEISLLQPIFTWGALSGATSAAREAVRLESARAEEMEQTAALRAAELYYGLLLTNALHRLTDQAGDVVQRAKREIERLIAEGDPDVDDADRYAVLITEQEYARRVVEVAQLRATAHAALRRQLMQAADVVVHPEHERLEPLVYTLENLSVYQEAALTARPEVTQALAGQAAAAGLVRAARADHYPQLVFGFSVTASGASNRYRQPNPYISDGFRRTSARTGFALRQKLNFSQTRAKVAQAQARSDALDHVLTGVEQVVLTEVEQAWRTLLIEQANVAAEDSALALTKEWLRVEQINFDLDLGDTENLVKAVQANLASEARYLESVRRHNMAVLRLLDSAGLLTRHYHLLNE